MWRALKAEIAYFWPWLFGGLGIAAFVVVLLSVLIRFLEKGDGPPIFVIAMFPIIAGRVIGSRNAGLASCWRVPSHHGSSPGSQSSCPSSWSASASSRSCR